MAKAILDAIAGLEEKPAAEAEQKANPKTGV